MIGPEAWALVVANSINNLGHGFGAVVFTAFLSRLCTDREITATHYALLSSLAVVGRTLMVGPSGYLAEAFGWPLFFAATVGFCLPGIALLYVLDRGQRQRAALLNQGAA
jgi:PAT family beta-lactamase induction signal transducer AmpG